MITILAGDVWLLERLISHDIQLQQFSFLSFLLGAVFLASLPLLAILVYQTTSCMTLRYRLDRNGITIQWAGTARLVPIRGIQRIVWGRELGGTIVRRRGLRWPGHERGEGAVPSIGRTRFLATAPLVHQLLLVTPGEAIAISPRDPEGFLQAFQSRQELGPNRLVEPAVHRARWITWSLWTDQTARLLLGAALLVNLGLFGYLCARFPSLDIQLPLHFNSLGQVDRIGTKAELFSLPIIGLIILGVNLPLGFLLYRRERAASYLLWGAAAAAQTLFWLATFSIVP
jgi:hypothetical protein